MSNFPFDRFVEALSMIPQTQAALARIPPQYIIATGHDDNVMLFITHVGDVQGTIDVLFFVISLAECDSLTTTLAETGGLIEKLLPFDTAMEIKRNLEDVGTDAELVLPTDD